MKPYTYKRFRETLELLARKDLVNQGPVSFESFEAASRINLAREAHSIRFLTSCRVMPFTRKLFVSSKRRLIEIEIDFKLLRLCDEEIPPLNGSTKEPLPSLRCLVESLKRKVKDLYDVFETSRIEFHKQNYDAKRLAAEMMALLAPYKRHKRDYGSNSAAQTAPTVAQKEGHDGL
jgi:hypothetical protein